MVEPGTLVIGVGEEGILHQFQLCGAIREAYGQDPKDSCLPQPASSPWITYNFFPRGSTPGGA